MNGNHFIHLCKLLYSTCECIHLADDDLLFMINHLYEARMMKLFYYYL